MVCLFLLVGFGSFFCCKEVWCDCVLFWDCVIDDFSSGVGDECVCRLCVLGFMPFWLDKEDCGVTETVFGCVFLI